jgi:hypothetical protein
MLIPLSNYINVSKSVNDYNDGICKFTKEKYVIYVDVVFSLFDTLSL